MFWRSINNKDVSEGWLSDEPIQEVIREMRGTLRGRCRWEALTEEEFDDVLRCTAPWKACGVDSVYKFPIKKMPANQEGCFRACEDHVGVESHRFMGRGEQLALQGRTVLIYKGGDRKDPANYRPIACLPTITKIVTLAIHKRMLRRLFGSVEASTIECEQRGVRTSQGCKEAVLENRSRM